MVTEIVVFIILTLAIYLFIVGHNQPGGGFLAVLVLSSAFVLLYLAHDIDTPHQGLPLKFRIVAAIGVFLAVGTGLGPCIFGQTSLTLAYIFWDVFLL